MYWACLRLVTTDPVTEERFRGPLPCPDNEIMSRRCLFDVQPNHYAALCKHPKNNTTLAGLFAVLCTQSSRHPVNVV